MRRTPDRAADRDPALALPESAASGGDGEDEAAALERELVVGEGQGGERLDRYLALALDGVSRNRIRQWIEGGAVLLNKLAARPREIVAAGDRVRVHAPIEDLTVVAPEAMALAVVWEDKDLIVIDKPAGLVVHPGAGNRNGTLLNGLLAYDPQLARLPRGGIVHRLDAGTSGLMVVARTLAAQASLAAQLQARTVTREYWAVVAGAVELTMQIDAPIGRDPRNPIRFRVSRAASARPARTHVRRILEGRLGDPPLPVSWVACRLETGRTHQIRVHLESTGHPLLGDPVYREHLPGPLAAMHAMSRQALHACRLELVHPSCGREMGWSSAPPPDLRALLRALGARAPQMRLRPSEPAAPVPKRRTAKSRAAAKK